jgi:hypothetical protein
MPEERARRLGERILGVERCSDVGAIFGEA